MNEYFEEFYREFCKLSDKELRSRYVELVFEHHPDHSIEKSKTKEESIIHEAKFNAIVEAFNRVRDERKNNSDSDFLYSDPIIQYCNMIAKSMENMEYFLICKHTPMSFEEYIEKKIRINEIIQELYSENTYENYKDLSNKYYVWLRKWVDGKEKKFYYFEDWILNIGRNEILERRYIKWICGEYNEQNRKQLHNKYIKYKILNSLGFNKDKNKLEFLDWLIELYGKEYQSYDKFIITK